MSQPRILPLVDLEADPQTWNERMAPGEYAVLYSGIPENTSLNTSTCAIFSSLKEAESFAFRQVNIHPQLRCRIYDHHGLGAQPIRELRGEKHKGESEISARLRRWGGCGFFFGGILLILIDWSTGFDLSWPAMVGARMAPVGLILLVTELVIVIEASRKKAHDHQATA